MQPLPDATLILKTRDALAGGLVEMVVWALPQPVPPSEHAFKCRLVYVRDGQRLVGYDNERGKGDHKHLGTQDVPYVFQGVEALLADFLRDVEAVK